MHHITRAKRTLKALLAAQLPIKLQEADAAVGDGTVTPPPYEIHTTDKADLGGLPSIELIVTDTTPQVDSLSRIQRHRVVAGVTIGGDDEETIAVQLESYLWAIREIIRDTLLSPPDGTAAMDTGGEQYTPLQQRPETVEQPFVKGGFLEVFIQTVE